MQQDLERLSPLQLRRLAAHRLAVYLYSVVHKNL